MITLQTNATMNWNVDLYSSAFQINKIYRKYGNKDKLLLVHKIQTIYYPIEWDATDNLAKILSHSSYEWMKWMGNTYFHHSVLINHHFYLVSIWKVNDSDDMENCFQIRRKIVVDNFEQWKTYQRWKQCCLIRPTTTKLWDINNGHAHHNTPMSTPSTIQVYLFYMTGKKSVGLTSCYQPFANIINK